MGFPHTVAQLSHIILLRFAILENVILIYNQYLMKEGNVLFNDALNTFYLWLYGVEHMVKYHSDSERKPAAATWATLSN